MRSIPIFFTIVAITIAAFSARLKAQSPFEVSLKPLEIEGLGGVQSFSVGQANGKWLIIGGRLDGLHRRQPWASFDLAGHNDQLIVVDPISEMTWSIGLEGLSTELQEQLRSTNMEFIQEGDHLYIVGGYGYSDIEGDHTTFPFFTAIDVASVIDATIDGTALSPHIRQFYNEEFAVTGGYLQKIEETFYLVGGQRFEGRYNPMNGPSFVQTYTNAILRFNIEDDGVDISFDFLDSWIDEDNLHRRDFNVVPQIMPDGQEGLTAFSGVFQQDADIPYLDCIDIQSSGYELVQDFSQYYNHYHCANIPLYSEESNEMHTVFFGGIAQYYDSLGILVQDNEVPFVKTIARVTRSGSGEMTEYKLPIEMPSLLGSGAEFIIAEGIPQLTNEIIDLDELGMEAVHIGYIYGGIESSEPNIFWVNDGTQSEAHSVIYKVYVNQFATGIDDLNEQSHGSLRAQIYPNPFTGRFFVDLYLEKPQDIELKIMNVQGKLVFEKKYRASQLSSGENELEVKYHKLKGDGIYFLTIESDDARLVQKLVVHK